MKANDIQVGGDHYKKAEYEPWDVIDDWGMGYFDGNALKYISRWKSKGGVNDLKKAQHYIKKLIELVGDDNKEVEPENPLVNIYNTFILMHEYAKNSHNHWLVAANIVRDRIDEIKK